MVREEVPMLIGEGLCYDVTVRPEIRGGADTDRDQDLRTICCPNASSHDLGLVSGKE